MVFATIYLAATKNGAETLRRYTLLVQMDASPADIADAVEVGLQALHARYHRQARKLRWSAFYIHEHEHDETADRLWEHALQRSTAARRRRQP
ncbi:hypothetical protein SDRG_01502 [Saprolegnia diclina VS20]|uniref:Uncharacterized protein n=1 Tax=Saprolegnia diclina (strain VS20) TaxID=1156394 RepID=T0QTQ2_SAPDV|nr:hypothetical protein SDRG_01502 [Saprolegnia diclina VS20]EQC41539.1 hypothetical protein SDRG_01502 [Saprolegnia diclina VS20]|eukprot:XP_008605253.1 hypothetical protein SDRG_01502 [Saprolegnia diclina VS20]